MEQLIEPQLTINDLINSKTYVKSNSGISFPSPNNIIEPFLEKLQVDSNIKYNIKVGDKIENANNDDGSLNIAYTRFAIEAELSSTYDPLIGESFSSTSRIGIMVALDTQTPLIKVYSGKRVTSCMNMTIFNSENLHQELIISGNINKIFEKAESYINNIEKDNKQYVDTIRVLNEKTYKNEKLHERIGQLVDLGISKKVGSNHLFNGLEALFTKSSRYYVPEGKEASDWHIFNSMTYIISGGKEFINQPEKVIKTAQIFL